MTAALSSAGVPLASATVVDFYEPLTHGARTPEHYLRVSRFTTIFWGAVLATIALFASHWGSVLESGLSIASVTLGILLGVFLLGVLTRRPGENAAIAGVITGAAAMIYIRFGTQIPFTWWVPIGSGATFGGGWLASMFLPGANQDKTGALEEHTKERNAG